MATHHPGTRVFGSITLTHQSGPQSPSCTKFSNFLKEVIMHIEEEREAWGKFIDLQATYQCSIYIGQTISDGKGQFLHSGRSGLANMVAADTDGIPARHMARPELNSIYYQTHGRLWR